jgi:hypothetical protein
MQPCQVWTWKMYWTQSLWAVSPSCDCSTQCGQGPSNPEFWGVKNLRGWEGLERPTSFSRPGLPESYLDLIVTVTSFNRPPLTTLHEVTPPPATHTRPYETLPTSFILATHCIGHTPPIPSWELQPVHISRSPCTHAPECPTFIHGAMNNESSKPMVKSQAQAGWLQTHWRSTPSLEDPGYSLELVTDL